MVAYHGYGLITAQLCGKTKRQDLWPESPSDMCLVLLYRCILGVIAMLIVLGTLYDVIAIQAKRGPANLQDKTLNTKAPSVNGVDNKGYLADTEISNNALEIESSLSNEGAVLSKADEAKEQDLHFGVKLAKESTNEQRSSGK